jgi:hypothetical protein
MSIGRTIRLLASLATAMLLASAEVLVTTIGLVRSTAAAAEPPNIVLVVTDDLTKRDYFDLGNNLSSFTSGGTFFHNAFVTTALCSPSRASTLTNLYAHNHHIHQHIDPGTGYEQYHAEGYDQKDLPVWLKDSGYKTGLVGKYMNKYDAQHDGKPAGWTDWYGADDPITNWTLYENGGTKPTRRIRAHLATSPGRTCWVIRPSSLSVMRTPRADRSSSGTAPTPRTPPSSSPRETRTGWGPGPPTTLRASTSATSRISLAG